MITPRFHLKQDKTTLTINIRAPYCSLRELEISVEEHVFIFICKPYYLRLQLPGQIIENDHSHSKFDAETGEFTFTYEKVIAGEEFSDLDFITKFLCEKVEVNDGNRKIEILTSQSADISTEAIESDVKYGFAMRGGYNFHGVSSEFYEIFEIDPHQTKLEDRNALRLKKEADDFDEDHYLADFLDGDEIQEFLHVKNPWVELDPMKITFTTKELDFLKDLTNIEYNLNEKQIKYCFNSLIEILYAYSYDRRTSFYEGTCESGWTISKLTATLSCFEGFTNVKDAIISSFRRSLIYPLYREFELSSVVFNDVKTILKLGEKFILKCLIEIYDIFLNSSSRYVLNNLFIKDYVTYVMKWDKSLWKKTVAEVLTLEISKNDLGLNLIDIESSEVGGEVELSEQLGALNLKEVVLDSDDESSSDDSAEDSTSTEYDSDDTTSSEEQS